MNHVASPVQTAMTISYPIPPNFPQVLMAPMAAWKFFQNVDCLLDESTSTQFTLQTGMPS